ncbi:MULTISPECIES: hypothetical protein [unclassified Butyrivibrio]|uniref:hypothetical protein n=1 Tax=unclassified Butyrivibrio TaxID=2639466 RepID=UPI0003FB5BAF|nr:MULTISPECIES: hypothetical protein [unclassified Butyrivibrio]MCR5342067.1 hypothetical protein [Butyrivibrio sp.]
MNINPMAIMALQQKLGTFKQEHPRVLPFLGAVKDSAMDIGTIIDMKVTTTDGVEKQCNIKITQNDIDIFQTLMNINNAQ